MSNILVPNQRWTTWKSCGETTEEIKGRVLVLGFVLYQSQRQVTEYSLKPSCFFSQLVQRCTDIIK